MTSKQISMTLQELHKALAECLSLEECDDFLRSSLYNIRPLFYGHTLKELHEDFLYLKYNDAFVAFINSNAGIAIRNGEIPSPSILTLLIFFLSLFEKTQQYTSISRLANILPNGSLRYRCLAIFEYKNITDTSSDYIKRFDSIVLLLQKAWDTSCEKTQSQCLDLLKEYAIHSIKEPKATGHDCREKMLQFFDDQSNIGHYSILQRIHYQQLLTLSNDELLQELSDTRTRIVESLHLEACELSPITLFVQHKEDEIDAISVTEAITQLPDFLDDQLKSMNAEYRQLRLEASTNFENTPKKNRIYLGTYFPRTVIESWNIFQELLRIPIISKAFSQKKSIRILDIGSGTGAAVIGILLALKNWANGNIPVDIISLDINEDALSKQGEILKSLSNHLPFKVDYQLRHEPLPFELDNFVTALENIAKDEGQTFDIVTSWKCLCEFYNVNYAQAQGIIRNSIGLASQMLVPKGLCVLSDITNRPTNHNFEYFSMILNREANEHDSDDAAISRTIIPIPCARNSRTCNDSKCFTQRIFEVNHRLAHNDITKISYRVLAPTAFAQNIIDSFTMQGAFNVNAHRPYSACLNGEQAKITGEILSGYTNFFE